MANLLLLLAAPTGATVSSGSAPPQSLDTGAETQQTFESALADLLGLVSKPAGSKPKGDAKLDPNLAVEPQRRTKAKPDTRPEIKPDEDGTSKPLITGVDSPVPAPPPPTPLTIELALPAEPPVATEAAEAVSVRKPSAEAMPVLAAPPFAIETKTVELQPTPLTETARTNPQIDIAAVPDNGMIPEAAPGTELPHGAFMNGSRRRLPLTHFIRRPLRRP